MRRMKQSLAVLLSVILMITGIFSGSNSINIYADSEEVIKSSVDGFEYRLKVYESGYKEYLCTTDETKVYTSYEEAVKGIADLCRSLIKEQKVKQFVLTIPMEIKCDSKIEQIENYSVDREITNEIYKETGNPEDGHTLASFGAGGGNFLADLKMHNPEYKDGSYKGIWHSRYCGYGDNTDRYNQTVEKLNTVLNDLDLDEKTDYEKCVEIMRWIAKNVKYDTHYAEHPEKPAKTQHPHDMTGAVLDGYCVCDGYAGVFYYMANAVGLHALYDDGWAYGGGHAWNLVQIDGTYYYIDLTGCASNFDKNGEIKDEFLWGSDNHYFRKEYVPDTDNIKNTYSNISKDDYFKEHSVCKGNHTMHETGEQLATCEDDAEIEYMCINEGCKYTKWTKTADALGHQMDNGTIIQKQTCDKPEITRYKCTRTDAYDGYVCNKTEDVPTKSPLGHIWDEGTETKSATCTTPGEITKHCTREGCTATKTEETAKLPHKYVENVMKAPTCTKKGVSTYTCIVCGDTTNPMQTDATGHQHTEIRNQKAATCEKYGNTGDVYCLDCKTTVQRGKTILPTGHTWGDWNTTKEPDCSHYGWKERICKTCRKSDGIVLEKTEDHKWNQGEVTTKPTCTTKGERTYTCTVCNKTMTEPIEATGHQHTEIRNQKAATCEETGYTGDTYCADCETKLETGKEIAATGHNWTDWKIEEEATETEDGVKTRTCTTCNTIQTESIPMISHHWDKGELKKEATCTTDGEILHKCMDEGCDKTYIETIKAIGHQHTVIKDQKDAACENDGYSGDIYCTDCNQMIQKGSVIKATGHQHKVVKNQKEATCQEEGYTGDTYCTDCNQLISEGTLIPKTDHKWRIVSEVYPSCDEPGVKTYECKICNKTKEEQTKATGHTWGNWKTTKDQTVFTGKQQKRTCKICGYEETRTIGTKLKPTIKTNASSLTMQKKQSTNKFIVTGLAKGDSVKSWTSSNKKLVTITGNKKGTCKIKAGKQTGKATLTIKLASGLTKTIKITIQKKAVSPAKIKNVPKKLTIKRKNTYQLKPVIEPITCTQKIKYKTSNKKIAKINSKGKITAVKKGTAKITISVGKKKIVCKVIVK